MPDGVRARRRRALARLLHRPRSWVGAGALACAAGALLSLPREVPGSDPTRPGLRCVLVDASASVTRARLSWARQAVRLLRDECRAAADAREDLCVVVFGDEVRVHFGPGDPDALLVALSGESPRSLDVALPPGADGASELSSALDAALPLLFERGRAPGRLVLATDGAWTGRDPGPRLAALAARGAGLEARALAPPDRSDLALTELTLPERASAGSPLGVRVGLRWVGAGGDARPAVAAHLDGPGGPRDVVLPAPPPAGLAPDADGALRWTARLDLPGRPAGVARVTLEARLLAADGTRVRDPVPEDDTLGGDVRVAGVREVAVVASPECSELAAALAAQPLPGFDFVPTALADVASRLSAVDVLLTLDVPPDALPGAALREFVTHGGGGWLATGGFGFLAGWTDGDAAAAGLLPLVPARETSEERDVILVVDGSGSMEGEPFQRVCEALFRLVPAASASDRVVLHFFTQVLGAPVFASVGRTPEERRAELTPLLEARVPRGGTAIGYSLRQLVEGRAPGARRGLVLLLTDGRSSDGSAELPELRRAFAAARLDLRVLAIGERPDRAYLRRLLLPGEELVEAGDLSGLARLLSLEVNRRRVRLGDALALVPVREGGDVGAAVVDAQLAAVPGEEWGTALGYVRAEARPAADVLWRSGVEAEPLLAWQAVGAGGTAALACTPGPEWSPWLAGRLELFAPVLDALGSHRDAREELALSAADGALTLVGVPVDDPTWPAEVEVELRAALAEGLEPTLLPLVARARLGPASGGAALDPRAARRGPAPPELGRTARGAPLAARVLDPTDGRVLAELPLRAPGPREWWTPPGGGGSRQVAGAGTDAPAGGVAARPDPVVRPRQPSPLAPWCLGLGLACLLVGGLASALPSAFGAVFGQGIPGSDRR